jgi:hypothetical protein
LENGVVAAARFKIVHLLLIFSKLHD